MRTRMKRFAAVLAASAVAVVAFVPAAANAEPKPFSGYYKDVQGGGNGNSECGNGHVFDLPPGQQDKQC